MISLSCCKKKILIRERTEGKEIEFAKVVTLEKMALELSKFYFVEINCGIEYTDKLIMVLVQENIYLAPNNWSKSIYSWSEKIQDQIKYFGYLVWNL